MQNEKIIAILLAIIIIVSLSSLLLIIYKDDILDNLNKDEEKAEEILLIAKDDYYVFYINSTENIVNVLDNDIYQNTTDIVIEILTEPTNGNVTVEEIITMPIIVYTPDENYIGTDIFTYKLSDELNNTHMATVTIEVKDILIELGDCADVDFILSYSNGTVFSTTYKDVAKQLGLYLEEYDHLYIPSKI